MPTFDDAALIDAVARAHSWRGVLRMLGLPPQSASALRSARRRAAELGLDYDHFTGQRTWRDRDLADAVRVSTSWAEVVERLGLASASGSARAMLRSHAVRLGIDVAHLAGGPPAADHRVLANPASPRHLDRAGPLLAAAWFTLRGYEVAWPLEPCRYDLLVSDSGVTQRIQVKTTTTKASGSWAVRISSSRRKGTAVYSPEEVDYFFVVDGDMTFYLIPLQVVGGYQVIYLRRYGAFVAGRERLDAA